MPIHTYKCDGGHEFERLFLTFKAADAEAKTTLCDICHFEVAERQISAPGQPILVGEGFYKPSQGGSIVNKRDVTKFIKEENIKVVDPETGGRITRKTLEKQVGNFRRKQRRGK